MAKHSPILRRIFLTLQTFLFPYKIVHVQLSYERFKVGVLEVQRQHLLDKV